MDRLFGTTLGYSALLVLAASGIGHLRHRGQFVRELSKHALWPSSMIGVVAGIVAVAELGVSLPAMARIVGLGSANLTGSLAAAALLFGLYCVYSAVLWRIRPGVPCACSSAGDPADGWTVIRAGVLTGSAIIASFLNGGAMPAAEFGWELTIGISFGLSFALVTWLMPRALRIPWDSRS